MLRLVLQKLVTALRGPELGLTEPETLALIPAPETGFLLNDAGRYCDGE